jgi:hypothetical protein
VSRRWPLVLLLLALAFPLGPAVLLRPPICIAAEARDCTVYATKSGARYHRAGCSSLSKSSIPMSRSEAVAKGLTPCSRCSGSDCEEKGSEGVAPPAGSGIRSPAPSPGETKDCTVYVTRSGARYHRADCSSLRGGAVPMSRSEAIRRGKTSCKRCGGSDCDRK